MKRLTWILLGMGAVLAAAGVLTAVGMHRHHDTVPEEIEEDGGIRNTSSGDDAPKAVQSKDITEFHCEFSTLAFGDPGELGNRVYTLEAVRRDETVQCTFKWYEHSGEGENTAFEADVSFLAALQETIEKHDLASFNGYTHIVNGLPDMYGAYLDICYASGESVYARDNQDCFLPMDTMLDLTALFAEQNKE